MSSVDEVIVGEGLDGSALGASLADLVHSVLLLERTTEFEDRVRGEWLAPWGIAEAQDLGLYDTLLAAGGHTLTRQATYDEEASVNAFGGSDIPLSALHPIGLGPLCLEHVLMQNALLERARETGVEVLRGVTGVEVTAGEAPAVRFAHDGDRRSVSCRLLVGADGRSSTVRRQVGIAIQEDPIDNLLAGLLIEGAHGWPEDLQATGKVGDLYYLVFPQGGGKVRLYADYDLERRARFTGPDGAREFLACFDMDCVPNSKSLAEATPIGRCAASPSQDAWTERPFAAGVVLVGDAAGYNDPIIGQGQAITLRDVRIVRDLVCGNDDWTPELFEPTQMPVENPT